MNCFAWNARVLGNPRAFRELRRLVAKSNPSILFISETKLYQSQYVFWRNYFQFKGIFSVDCEGRKWGLALLWNDPYDINICSYSNGHMLSMSNLFGGLQVSTVVPILKIKIFLGSSLIDYIISTSFNIFHG